MQVKIKGRLLNELSNFKNNLKCLSKEQVDQIHNLMIENKNLHKPIKFYFKKAPLSVTLMMLSKFQQELRLIEYLILDRDFSSYSIVDHSYQHKKREDLPEAIDFV